jgi:general secretion pathway protein I
MRPTNEKTTSIRATAIIHPAPPHGVTVTRYRGSAERGFLLLEVLIAFAIVALALGVLSQSALNSLRSLQAAARYEEAVARARSRLAIAVHGAPLAASDQQGDDGSGFRWRVLIAPVANTSPRPLANRGPRRQLRVQTVLYAVSVWVWWTEGEGPRREVRLDTQRVASALQ